MGFNVRDFTVFPRSGIRCSDAWARFNQIAFRFGYQWKTLMTRRHNLDVATTGLQNCSTGLSPILNVSVSAALRLTGRGFCWRAHKQKRQLAMFIITTPTGDIITTVRWIWLSASLAMNPPD